MPTGTTPPSCTPLLVLDEGQASSLDALAASVSIFGAGRFQLVYADDLDSLVRMTGDLARRHVEAVVVVDADHDPAPKDLLATAAETGFPLVVLSDGRDGVIHDHALSVGAAAYLLSELPARELVDRLGELCGN